MNIAIRFVGGPADGRTMTIPNLEPPPLYLVPVEKPLAEILANPEPSPIQTAEYVPICEDSSYQRTRDGVFLYRYRVAPPTVDERRALEERRRVAREAEEQRVAELDATWQEIRRERPHYPADWRDL